MGVKILTPQRQVEQMILTAAERRVKTIINVFCIAGESCITKARNEGSYQDQTGNLRSSIGYVVLNNGRIVQRGESQQIGGGGDLGVKECNEFMQSLVRENRTGIVLIVSAGMNYAINVEAKGYDVLTSSELYAEQLSTQMLSNLGFKV